MGIGLKEPIEEKVHLMILLIIREEEDKSLIVDQDLILVREPMKIEDKEEEEEGNRRYSSHVSKDGDKKSDDAYDDDKEDFERKLKPKYNDSSSLNSGFNADNAFGGKKNGDKNPETYDPDQREIFPFRIFIKDIYLTEGIASRNEIDDIIKKTGIKSISLDNQT